MNLKGPGKILREHVGIIKENVKQAKAMVDSGKLSKEDLDTIVRSSPDPKYVGWMAKVWVNEKPDIDDLRNKVEEYDTFLKKGKAKTKDIYAFKKFADLSNEVEYINQSGEGVSSKDLENDYETVVNDSDMVIMVPHTHEASRKLGLSVFSFRDCAGGGKDSAWCTTYKSPDHFNDYYYGRNVTFYYIRIKPDSPKIEELKEKFPKRWKQLQVVALALFTISKKNKIDGYDGLDRQMDQATIKKYMEMLGLSL